MAFTEGPWRVGFGDGSGAKCDDNHGAWIIAPNDVIVVRGGDFEGVPIGVVQEGDARLIAAALQMFKACQIGLETVNEFIKVAERHNLYSYEIKFVAGILRASIGMATKGGKK